MTVVIAIIGVSGVLISALIAGSIALWNGRKDRQHRELMAHLEDWRGQRDVATSLVRSPDPNDRKRGFAQLAILENDPAVPQTDREFIQQIRELVAEGVAGRALFAGGNTVLQEVEKLALVKIEPASGLPEEAALVDVMNQNLQDFHKALVDGGHQMRFEGIQMYGGLPPDQQAS
ncbi:hypothetical protein P5V93_13605 [Mycobacteroides abscessus subsp. abscessus]|uniref:hypothetical protein n=1 Tax=Mycobacteroides abscessus TaxID=36809 RepID=UPI00092604A1|nr:hypothetical protein [Mycobacteroides abscessus]AWG52020.1 hypothetical protein DDT48_23320 [Mycobacteroides abscessus]MBN7550958.1 hypothetical protein [Mycobacteroides abscessus subsp. abscessus]MDM2421483.1 hypothetical protein [Mycobacteroides abscessus]MDM2427860.1 hypothetical protein [Mycobacteroides abscessus]MDM2432922.1 hypothetical protein [Mycobacteroides abscessus]